MFAMRRLAAILALAALFILPAAAQTHTVKVTFILVNDIYQMTDEVMPDGKRRGGFARLAAVVKAERAKGGHVVFAHAGDTLSPSLMSGMDSGAHIVALTNMIPPDIFVPGNHEYDFGKDVFLQRMAETKFPLYAANLRDAQGAALPGFRDRKILEFNGVRIGLTGATAEDSRARSNPGDLAFAPIVETVKAQNAALRGEGADFVVAVVHADRNVDQALLQNRAADLILSGDDHDLYLNYDGRTAIAESSSDAHYVTAIEIALSVTMRDGRREVAWWPQFRVIDTATVSPDPAVAAAVQKYQRQWAAEIGAVVATTATELDSRQALLRSHEAGIGNVIADAMRSATNADAALTNGGGIRAAKIYRAGSTITMRDILSELPFRNHIALLELSGAELRRALENGLSRLPQPDGRFPQVSGLRVEADASRPAGSRITAIQIGGAPLDETKTYRLATNDFLARGGDGYDVLRGAKPLMRDYDRPLLTNAVAAHLRKLGTLRMQTEGRVVVK